MQRLISAVVTTLTEIKRQLVASKTLVPHYVSCYVALLMLPLNKLLR